MKLLFQHAQLPSSLKHNNFQEKIKNTRNNLTCTKR